MSPQPLIQLRQLLSMDNPASSQGKVSSILLGYRIVLGRGIITHGCGFLKGKRWWGLMGSP